MAQARLAAVVLGTGDISSACSADCKKWVGACDAKPWTAGCQADPSLVCPSFNSSFNTYLNSVKSGSSVKVSASGWCPSSWPATCIKAGQAVGVDVSVCTVNEVVSSSAQTVELDDQPQCMPSSCSTDDIVAILQSAETPTPGVTRTFTASCGIFGMSYETFGIVVVLLIVVCSCGVGVCMYKQCRAKPNGLSAPINGGAQVVGISSGTTSDPYR
jgi:hypothetical protein